MRRRPHPTPGSTADALARLSLFAATSARERQRLAAHTDRLVVRAGERLVLEGTAPRALLGLVSGRVTVRHLGEHLATLEAGDHLGLSSVLTGDLSPVTVTAATDVEVLVVAQPAFLAAVQTMPAVADRVARAMAIEARRTTAATAA